MSPTREELEEEKLALDIEKLRLEMADRNRIDRREQIKLLTTVVGTTAAVTLALVAVATLILSKLL